MHLLISFLPSAVFKTSGTWTQAGLRHSFHRNIESLGLDKTLHSFTQDNQFLSVSFQLYTGQPPSDWDLIPSSCIGRQRKQSIPWFSMALMKTYFTPTQATFPLKWRPLAYVVIPSTETISLRLEKRSCFLTSTTSCCHSTKGLAAMGDSSGVLGHVQCGGGSFGVGSGIAGPVNAFRAQTFLKDCSFNCISSKNLGKYGTVLQSTRWQSSQK